MIFNCRVIGVETVLKAQLRAIVNRCDRHRERGEGDELVQAKNQRFRSLIFLGLATRYRSVITAASQFSSTRS